MEISYKQFVVFFNSLILILGTAHFTSAQTVLESNASLLDVTIYNSGAELHHVAKQVRIPGENSEIIIDQIAQSIDPKSIRVSNSSGQVTILSVSFERDYLNKGENKSEMFLEMQRKYENANSILNDFINRRKGEESTLALLEENRRFGGQAGVTPDFHN